MKTFFGILGVSCLAGFAGAINPGPFYLGVHVKNDAVAGTDRYNTHATRLDLRFPANTEPWPLDGISRLLPDGPDRDRVVGLYLAQYAFTSSDIEDADPPPTDRPYGGWLHIGLNASVATRQRRADTFSLNIGCIGPAAGADRLQLYVHKLIGSPEPSGWGTQLPNEPAVDFSFERRWKPHPAKTRGFGWEWIPHVGGNAGSVFVLCRAGATVRAGFNMPDDFGSGMFAPAEIRTSNKSAPAPRWGVNLFATVDSRYVFHNVFLDGSLFHSSRSVSKEPWVTDIGFGIQSVLLRDFVLTNAFYLRSREFEDQAGAQQFGMLHIGYWF